MKVCLFQNYSSNNQALFDLTVGNYLKYCAKNNYTALLDNGPYSPYINCHLIKSLLQEYDFVFTAGSDCVFTNTTPVESFLDSSHDFGIQMEGLGGVVLNGEVLLFKATDNSVNFLDHMYIEQLNNPGKSCGFQAVLTSLYKRGLPDWAMPLQVLDPGTIQKYLVVSPGLYSGMLKWCPGTLIAHAILGTLQQKFSTCEQFLKSGNVRL